MAPDNVPDPGHYPGASEINTDQGWLNQPGKDGKPGGRVLGDGVKADLDGLTGFSKNLNQIQMNFEGLARAVYGPMKDMMLAAFPVEGTEYFHHWNKNFLRLAGHNAGQIQIFFGELAIGIKNVASAAQAVSNAYAKTDSDQASAMNAIAFAFADPNAKTPPQLKAFLDRVDIPTWAELKAQRPGTGVVVPDTGIPPENMRTETSGNTTTLIITLPNNGGEIRVATTKTDTGTVEVTSFGNQALSTTTTVTSGGTTTRTTTTHVYDDKGKHLRDQTTEVRTETVTKDNDKTVTESSTKSYTYDQNGKQLDENETRSKTAVGNELPHQDPIVFGSSEDPLQNALDEANGKDETVPSPNPGVTPSPSPSPGATTSPSTGATPSPSPGATPSPSPGGR